MRVVFLSTESSSSQQEGGLHEAAPEVLHLILTNLLYGPKDQFGNKHLCLNENGILLYHVQMYVCSFIYIFFLFQE